MKRDRGNREWLNDYPSLKQVNPENPFTVPEGYFDSLDERILSRIKVEELKNQIPDTGFTVPENYFEKLTGNIQARITVEGALDKEETAFSVPDGYFEGLSEQIQSRIFVEEALNAQPEGFAVPENYFNDLSQNILNKATQLQKEKKKGVIIKMFSSAAFKYATAACLVLAVGGTLFLSQNNSNPEEVHKNSFLHKSLSAIPIDDIQDYLQLHLDGTDTRTLMDASKPADADNLSNELQDALDTSQ
jgi:hypothetical protein